MSEKGFAPPSTAKDSFGPERVLKYLISTLKFNGDCLKQNSESFINGDVSNLCISYKFNAWSKDLKGDLALSNCLFGVVKLTKNADLKLN